MPVTTLGGQRRVAGRDALAYAGLALFALTIVLSIATVKLGFSRLPFRMFTLLGSGACMMLADWTLFTTALRRAARLLAVVAALAILGTVVSVLAANRPVDIAQQLVEIHLQAIVGTMVSYMLVLRFGVRRVLAVFLFVFAADVAVAAAQALHINAAWVLRARIGRLMNDPALTQFAYLTRYRPLGFSYTPILFATQSCLALAAIYFYRNADGRLSRGRIDVWLLAGMVVCAIACVLTGNRSPLVGFAVFAVMYLTLQAPAIAAAVLPLGLLAAAIAFPFVTQHAEQTGLRALNFANSSASNRTTLRDFGLFLIQQRPIGYGLVFDSTDYWTSFFEKAIYLPNPASIRVWSIHNYFIIMVAKYGVVVLTFLVWLWPRTREQAWLWLPFAPYLVHIYYHNEGPLLNDFLIFFLLPAAIEIARRAEQRVETAASRPLPWRRAFAPAAPSA